MAILRKSYLMLLASYFIIEYVNKTIYIVKLWLKTSECFYNRLKKTEYDKNDYTVYDISSCFKNGNK